MKLIFRVYNIAIYALISSDTCYYWIPSGTEKQYLFYNNVFSFTTFLFFFQKTIIIIIFFLWGGAVVQMSHAAPFTKIGKTTSVDCTLNVQLRDFSGSNLNKNWGRGAIWTCCSVYGTPVFKKIWFVFKEMEFGSKLFFRKY